MNDSKVYSSLFALVDSHLSKTSVQDNGEDSANQTIKMTPFNNIHLESNSETSIPSQSSRRFPISPFDVRESPIANVLAQQVTNMLKAKELKKQNQERIKLEEELKQLQIEEEKSTVIDLMKAIQTPYKPDLISNAEETLSNSSSCESLFKLNFQDCDDEPEKTKTPEPLLPCTTDMSYILKQKIKRDKASAFGRVVTSRLRPVAAPYLRQIYPTRIIRFTFNTPSPCDVIKEKLRRPTMSSTFTVNNLEDFQ